MSAVEIVTFNVTPDATSDVVIQAAEELNDWLRDQPGFLNRTLAHVEGSKWVDIVHWASMDHATTAAQLIMQDMGSCQFMTLVVPDSVAMQHGFSKLTITV